MGNNLKIIKNIAKNLLDFNKLSFDFDKFGENYVHVANAGPTFGKNFKEYFISEDISKHITKLKKNLDDKSIEIINRKIQQFLNFPLFNSIYAANVRVLSKEEVLFTHEEIEELKKFKEKLPQIKRKYKGFNLYNPESFFYHHGLKFLDDRVIRSLENKDFIDIGAFNGDTSIIFNEYNPNKVFAFEITKDKKNNYYKNLEYNNVDISKFIYIEKAVSNKDEIIHVSGEKELLSLNVEEFINDKTRNLEKITLDKYFNLNKNIGLIQMDIEGSEIDAIQGARRIIMEQSPVLLISIYHTPEQFFELKPYIESINPNYSFMIRNLNFMGNSELETTLICSPKK